MEENIKTESGGLTNIHSDKKRDPQIVRRFNKFINSANGCDVYNTDNKAIKAFCDAMKEDEQKVIRALVADSNRKAEVAYVGMEEGDEDISYSPFSCYSFGQYKTQETENELTRFEDILLRINEIFTSGVLKEKEKKIYSAWFSALFIKLMVIETKDINKYDSLECTLESHFDSINLNAKKEMYASGKYFCIYAEVFDYVAEHKKLVTQKDVADFFECKGSYVKKVFDKINELLKQDE